MTTLLSASLFHTYASVFAIAPQENILDFQI